jgi:hypothetical protein
MAAIARVLARAFPNTSLSHASLNTEVIKLLVLFCSAGLLISLLLVICGLDLSTDF